MSVGVRISSSRSVILGALVVCINVRYGAEEGLDGKWALTISKRTGKWAGTEALETFAWHSFTGSSDRAELLGVRKWLKANGFNADDRDLVVLVVKQLNKHYVDTLVSWYRSAKS